MKLLFLGASSTTPACRFRLLQLIPHLERLGHQVRYATPCPAIGWKSAIRRPRAAYWLHTYAVWILRAKRLRRMIETAGMYDAVFMNRDLLPERRAADLERALVGTNARLVFDFDDAIYLNSPREKIADICRIAAWVTPGNEELTNFARLYNAHVTTIPTVADTEVIFPVERRRDGPLRVGWIGTDESYAYTFTDALKKELSVPLARHGSEMVIVKETQPELGAWPGATVRFIPWSAEGEVGALQYMDVGLMPLVDSPFQRGKCGAKLVQYMAAGIPVIASPVGANRRIVADGVTGFLAASGDSWSAALGALLVDEQKRLQMGAAGRRRCELEYSISSQLPRLLDLFRRVGP